MIKLLGIIFKYSMTCCFNNKNKYKHYLLFSKEEVQNFHTNELCYIRIKNKVYDVTDFINLHPKGSEVILKCAKTGEDCEIHYKFHSKKAQKNWDSYFIGYIVN